MSSNSLPVNVKSLIDNTESSNDTVDEMFKINRTVVVKMPIDMERNQIVNLLEEKLNEKFTELKSDFQKVTESNQNVIESNQNLTNMIMKQMKIMNADKNIHKLSHFISDFRQKIVDNYNLSSVNKFSGWKELVKDNKSKRDAVEIALNIYKLSQDDWNNLSDLVDDSYEIEHKKYEYGKCYELIDQLEETEYEKYVESLKKLINLYEKYNI